MRGRRAGQQGQHPGANLQRYSFGETWGQEMEGQAGLLNEGLWQAALASDSMATDITAAIADSTFNSGTAANCQSTGCV
jgi:hypothetical protein